MLCSSSPFCAITLLLFSSCILSLSFALPFSLLLYPARLQWSALLYPAFLYSCSALPGSDPPMFCSISLYSTLGLLYHILLRILLTALPISITLLNESCLNMRCYALKKLGKISSLWSKLQRSLFYWIWPVYFFVSSIFRSHVQIFQSFQISKFKKTSIYFKQQLDFVGPDVKYCKMQGLQKRR